MQTFQIKRALKAAKAAVKDNTMPRSSERQVGYWGVELVGRALNDELVAEQNRADAQRKKTEAKF